MMPSNIDIYVGNYLIHLPNGKYVFIENKSQPKKQLNKLRPPCLFVGGND